VTAEQFPDLGIEHSEILEMVDVHHVLSDRSHLGGKFPPASPNSGFGGATPA
jgi:hypothetical protein